MGNDSLIIERQAIGPFMKNGFVVGCTETSEAVYIDPGDEVEVLMNWVNKEGLTLKSILNTHGHADHICGIGSVKECLDIPIYLHEADRFLYDSLPQQGAWMGFKYDIAPPVDLFLDDNDVIHFGKHSIRVHHTPGHSPGSVSFEIDEHVFCGDLLFSGSIGRTDLPGGDLETLLASVRSKIFPLGDNKILHSGHGPDTTIGEERSSNPFLTGIR
jgi:glyoxylase-like metal-dependent hydrolase (beta-lactamase superfamily II)